MANYSKKLKEEALKLSDEIGVEDDINLSKSV